MAGPIEAAGDLAAEVQQLRERVMILEDRLAPVVPGVETVPFYRMTYAWVQRLAAVVADEWGVTAAEVIGHSRLAVIVRPRFVLCWLLRETARYPLPKIGSLLSSRDHTSIIHAIRRVDQWRKDDDVFRHTTDQMLVIARRLYAEARPSAAPAGEEAP